MNARTRYPIKESIGCCREASGMLAAKNHKAAAELFDEALHHWPENADAWNGRGETHFELSLEYVIRLAETDAAIKRLLREIEKTNRRVNALEFVVQPDLRSTIKDVGQHLTMLESELFFALKVTKRRLARKQARENAENVKSEPTTPASSQTITQTASPIKSSLLKFKNT